MGCTSSSPAAAAAAPGAPASADPKRTREREVTAGTEAMAVASEGPGQTQSAHNGEVERGGSQTNDESAEMAAEVRSFPPLTASRSVKVGDLSLRYACKSRRGRDPDHPSKPNQDCYGHHTNPSMAYFAVYDGHGPRGELCSHFLRTKLPAELKKNLQRRGTAAEDAHSSLHDAHVACNDALRKSTIDDSHSGTTSVGVLVHDGKVTVSNVGDSRIVLGTAPAGGGAIQAVPLSRDHTPHRADEAARCESSGARILSFGQIDPSSKGEDEDDVEDPPRVWAREGKYPGTAFTRSVGDAVAESLGVYAEPEMTTLPISSDERLLLLASDGVFDVVSNQTAVDLCYRHRHDPARACEAVVEKSHEEWLLNDDCGEDEANYDDMTCVVIYFDHLGQEVPPMPPSPTAEEGQAKLASPSPRHGKRVRQKTLRNLEAMEEKEKKEGA